MIVGGLAPGVYPREGGGPSLITLTPAATRLARSATQAHNESNHMTTVIQFYHLLSTSPERAVPKLMEKVLSSGSRAVMIANSDSMLKTMSDALWSNNPSGFLPHGSARDGHASEQPIYLSLVDENPNGADILCILDGSSPASIPTYSKVLDVFDGVNDDAVAAARTRWAHYKAQGFALQYVKQQPSGSWKVEMISE
jgi:DNA polymerase III subunit chi